MSTSDLPTRVRDLEAAPAARDTKIAHLEAELERLRPPAPKPAPNPYPDGRVTVTGLRVPVVLPTESDLRRLLAIPAVERKRLFHED
jgi:hypothetical protein